MTDSGLLYVSAADLRFFYIALVRAVVHCSDGEKLEGEVNTATITDSWLVLNPREGNVLRATLGVPHIKYVQYPDFPSNTFHDSKVDPREKEGVHERLVIAFADGERLRTFRDGTFQVDTICYHMTVWDKESQRLVKTVVPVHAIKAIFQVREFDSRDPLERFQFDSQREG